MPPARSPPPGLPLGAGTAEVWRLLAAALPEAPHVRWAIIDLLAVYVTARAPFDRASDPQEVGAWLQEALAGWLQRMPIGGALGKEPCD